MSVLKRILASTVVLAALGYLQSATACPNCKEALASQTGEGAKLKDGYYYSILLMVAMPFTLLGTGAFCVVRAVKRGGLPEM